MSEKRDRLKLAEDKHEHSIAGDSNEWNITEYRAIILLIYL